MTDEFYSISELAEATGVTPRTIRYYTAEGLLPQAETQGKYARYSADHRNRLRLIARLKDAYLPLHEIRQQIAPLTPEQVGAMLGDVTSPIDVAESSAEDYITDVIARQRTLRVASAMPEPQMQAPQAAAPAPVAPASSTDQLRTGGFFKRLMPQRRSAQTTNEAQTGETWRHITLAPGIELHIRETGDAMRQQRVQQLLDRARELFAPDGQA